MSRHTLDVCVIGAGPAGALVAHELARRGRSVTLVGEPAAPHRLETLTSPPTQLLLTLELRPVLALATAARISQVEITWRRRAETRNYGSAGPLLVSRPRLDRLLGEAAGTTGARLRPRARVREIHADTGDGAVRVGFADNTSITARIVVDAAGRRAVFRARSVPLCPPVAAVGFTGRGEPAERTTTSLEAVEDGWIWMARLVSGRIHGVYVTDPSALVGLDTEGRRRLLAGRVRANIALEPRYVTDAGLAAAQCVVEGSIVRVGDAALARDPISSHGLAQALGSAARAAIAIDTMLDPTGEHDAAVSFLDRRHEEALEDARVATVQAYAEQGRFPNAPFWTSRGGRWRHSADAMEVASPPRASRLRVHPDAVLTRQPVLDHERVVWGDALLRPATGRSTAFLGGTPASMVRSTLEVPGTPDEITERLVAVGVVGQGVVDELWRTGVLVLDRGS